jgi:hypothetical protein
MAGASICAKPQRSVLRLEDRGDISRSQTIVSCKRLPQITWAASGVRASRPNQQTQRGQYPDHHPTAPNEYRHRCSLYVQDLAKLSSLTDTNLYQFCYCDICP